MITSIEALNFRCFRYIKQSLNPFNVLVGPNASGKTTFLEVVSFLGQLVSDGLESAIASRTNVFHDLVWRREGTSFELAIEASIPEELRKKLTDGKFNRIRYEVAIGILPETKEIAIFKERAMLKQNDNPVTAPQRVLFPIDGTVPETLFSSSKPSNKRAIVTKNEASGNVNFHSEVSEKTGKGWTNSFKLGTRRSALANLPEDETQYPVTTWLKSLLSDGVQPFILNSLALRRASAPGQLRGFKPDGSNLPWVVNSLFEKHPARYKNWIAHIQTALPDIENIRTKERPDDKHRYLIVQYKNGLEIPSWTVSDGTLRLFALTIPAYLPEFEGIYLIEEPENGIHPRAVETMFQSLSSTYDAQILIATHSPIVLSAAEIDTILCFAKTSSGAGDIILGSAHPALRDWRKETNLGELFAAGILG